MLNGVDENANEVKPTKRLNHILRIFVSSHFDQRTENKQRGNSTCRLACVRIVTDNFDEALPRGLDGLNTVPSMNTRYASNVRHPRQVAVADVVV